MPMQCLSRAFLLALLLSILGPAARADSAYICTLGGLFGILDFSGHTFRPLGNTPTGCSGLGFDSADNLYTVEVGSGRFDRINPANGSSVTVGNGTGANNWVMAQLATGALFEIDFSSNLRILNPATGAAAVLGPIGLPPPGSLDAGGLTGAITALYYTFNDPSLPDAKSILYKINPASCCAAQRIGTDTGFNFIGELAYVNGTLYGFDNIGKNVLKVDTTTGAATVLFPFPAALASDKVDGAVDVALGQRMPGRFSAGAPGGQIIAFNADAASPNAFNLAPYDYGPFVQSASVASIPSVALTGMIAFASGRNSDGARVYVMNSDASGVKQITFADSTGANDQYPTISPDGTKVAFMSGRAVFKGYNPQKLFAVNTDGTGLRQVDAFTIDSNGNTGDGDEGFAWSPDSTKLAFRAVRLSNICNPKGGLGFQDIVGIIGIDGTGERDLACDQAPHGAAAIDWSPDGNLIAFSRSTDLGDPSIAVIDLTGVTRYSFPFAQVGACGNPRCIHFSPDSKQLAVEAGSFTGVTIVNLDGSGRTQTANLTYSPDNFWWAPGPAFPKPAQITLTPDPVLVWPGHNQQLVPSLLDTAGNVITHAVEGFGTSNGNGSCAAIDAAGLASLTSPNSTTMLLATNGGLHSNTVTIHCLAQQPVIPAVPPNGVVNNAGFTSSAPGVSPGLIAAIFGSNLSTATVNAIGFVPGTTSLYTTYQGTAVTFDNIPAPLFGLTPGQIDVQVPFEVAGKTSTQMVITLNGIPSAPVTIPVLPATPGIVTVNSSGAGPGVIQNHDGSLNTADNPEARGNLIQIYATGLGALSPTGVTGAAAPSSPLSTCANAATATIDGVPVTVGPADSPYDFCGLSPGFVGLWQVNVQLPAAIGTGALTLRVTIGGVASNQVTVFVK